MSARDYLALPQPGIDGEMTAAQLDAYLETVGENGAEAVRTSATGTTESDWLAGTPMDPAGAPTDPLPTLAGFPFVHRGSGAVIVGPTGGGRSSLIQACLYDGAAYGLRAAYLGSEVTEGEFNARAAALAELRGDEIDDELRARTSAVRYLNLASTIASASSNPQAWVQGVAQRYELVAIDPLSAVASALDLDFDQRNAEFIRFYDKLIAPLTACGVAVVMVDNVGHPEEAKHRAKGVSAKSDRADLTFACANSSNPVGLTIKAQKVRTIRAGFQRGDEWLFDRDTQRIERRERSGSDSTERGLFRPTAIMQKVSETVKDTPGLSKRAIRTAVNAKRDYVDLALELLIAEGYIELRQKGQAHHHHVLKPYLSGTDAAS